MKRIIELLVMALCFSITSQAEIKDTLFVARDGTAPYRNVADAVEVVRAFMDYTMVIYVKKGVYKEKLVIPSWVKNVEIVGEDRNNTIITYDDHANINKMGTFRTYTVKVEGSDITFKNITIENNSAQLGQAVALHTEGDRLLFVNCRFLGHQDTVYTGSENARLWFRHCYIEGTTDFIFGPSTAYFSDCDIYCKRDSYITAASTVKDIKYGYVFDHCHITAAPGVTRLYLGRPWRPYGYTLFMYCDLCKEVLPEGWFNWNNPENEKTARYLEYKNTGEGASVKNRVSWSHQLSKKEAEQINVENVLGIGKLWIPLE